MIHYVNCRSTAALESFQNLRICYAAKRQAYQFEAYTARNQLAALDHMAHKDRPIKTNLDGTEEEQLKYYKAAQRHILCTNKVKKDHAYLPELQVCFLLTRLQQEPQSKRPKLELTEGH